MTDWDRLPIDPDVDPIEDAHHHPGVVHVEPSSRWPRLPAAVLGAVFAGGCIGGLLRFAVTDHWTSGDHTFPWAVFAVNVVGAFVLAVLIVVVSERAVSSVYLRPLLGTGFCGGFTTFSSIVVTADQLFAHGYGALATTYLLATIGVGVAVGALGVVLARRFVA